jgi:hypothetical protein
VAGETILPRLLEPRPQDVRYCSSLLRKQHEPPVLRDCAGPHRKLRSNGLDITLADGRTLDLQATIARTGEGYVLTDAVG